MTTALTRSRNSDLILRRPRGPGGGLGHLLDPGGGLGHLWSLPRPVGRPRQPGVPSQPTAAAGAGPDFSCAGELEQPLKPRIGKMCRPLVGASVAPW